MKNVLKAVGYLIYYVVFQVVVMSGIAMALVVSNRIGSEAEIEGFMNNNALGLTIISNVLTILLLFVFFRIRKTKLTEEINLKKVEWKDCILPSLAAFSFSMCFSLATYHMNFANAQQIQMSVAHYSGIMPYLGAAVWTMAILVVSPITEEIICRGLILTRLQRKVSDVAAVLLSGLFFGIIHLAAGGITLVIGAAIMGVIFGFICIRTKSLLPAIISHSIANTADLVIAWMPELSKGIQAALMLFFLTAFGVLMYLLIRKNEG